MQSCSVYSVLANYKLSQKREKPEDKHCHFPQAHTNDLGKWKIKLDETILKTGKI